MKRRKSRFMRFDDPRYRGVLSHHTDHARDCAECGAPMTSSDENDYGTLCRRCYLREYYPSEYAKEYGG